MAQEPHPPNPAPDPHPDPNTNTSPVSLFGGETTPLQNLPSAPSSATINGGDEASHSTSPSSVSDQNFMRGLRPAELVEQVLVHLNFKTLMRCMKISRGYRPLIMGSNGLREKLFLPPKPNTKTRMKMVCCRRHSAVPILTSSNKWTHRVDPGVSTQLDAYLKLVGSGMEVVRHPAIWKWAGRQRRPRRSHTRFPPANSEWASSFLTWPPVERVAITTTFDHFELPCYRGRFGCWGRKGEIENKAGVRFSDLYRKLLNPYFLSFFPRTSGLTLKDESIVISLLGDLVEEVDVYG